jgi:hypothetical protein
MNTRNQQVLGALAEIRFVSDYILCKGLPSAFTKATYMQDRTEHWDVNIDGVKIDVKGKRHSRLEGGVQDKYSLFEFYNVSGTKGWGLGDADKIAYEFDKSWVVVNRDALHKRLIKEIDPEDKPTVPSYGSKILPYKLTSRERKDDVYIWFPVMTLLEDGILDYSMPKIADDTKLYHLNA